MNNTDTAHAAQQLMIEMLDKSLLKRLDAMLKAGTAEWVPDPSAPMVWGLQAAGKVRLVAYLEHADFEADDEWWFASE